MLTVELSAELGASWQTVETVGPAGPEAVGGWRRHVLHVRGLAPSGGFVILRFVASDLGGDSTVEAAIDDLRLSDLACEAQLADCNGNGIDDDIASGRSLDFDGDGVPAGRAGLVYMGPAAVRAPFGDGLRCVGAGGVGVFRFPVRQPGAGGAFVEGPGIAAHSRASFPPAGRITAGATWRFQAWYRDPGGPCGTGFDLTNAVAARFGP